MHEQVPYTQQIGREKSEWNLLETITKQTKKQQQIKESKKKYVN